MHRSIKYGCFGCLGVVAIVIAFGAAVFGIAYSRAQREEIVEREWSRPVQSTDDLASTAPGRVVVDVSGAELVIEPAKPGDDLHIEASYAENAYELVERFEPGKTSGWSYEVRLRRKGSSVLGWLQTAFSGSMARVHVWVPADIPIELVASIGEGVADVELESLWITRCELTAMQGEMRLNIQEPLREPMEQFVIRMSKGGGAFTNLGNASPREMTIDTNMGGMVADLSGRWLRDADISISSRMGGTTVRFPRDVTVRGVDLGVVALDPQRELDGPTLTVTSSSQFGDIDFRR